VSFEIVLRVLTDWVYPAVLVVAFFAVTIFVHELGHFLVAKRRRMVIERFSIGFGPKIFGWVKDGIDYRVSWLPFGGYVALPQMSPMEAIEGGTEAKREELPVAPPSSRILVALAGPAMNMVFALALAAIIWGVGAPANLPVIGWVEPDSAAGRSGLHSDDRITAVNDEKVDTWEQFLETVAFSREPMVKVTVTRDGHSLSYLLETKVNEKLGVKMIDLNPKEHPFARSVKAGSAAAAAGIQPGDQFVSIEGMPIYSSEQVIKLIRTRRDEPTVIKMLRDGKPVVMTVVPAFDPKDQVARIGVMLGDEMQLQRPGPTPMAQFTEVFRSMGRLVGAIYHSKETGVSVRNIQGPVGILPAWWYEIVLGGIRRGMVIAVLLNINLAILNLLPFPVLDGGHILFAVVEILRRKPLNTRLVHITSMASAVALITFIAYVSWNNLEQWFLPDRAPAAAVHGSEPTPASQPAPQP